MIDLRPDTCRSVSDVEALRVLGHPLMGEEVGFPRSSGTAMLSTPAAAGQLDMPSVKGSATAHLHGACSQHQLACPRIEELHMEQIKISTTDSRVICELCLTLQEECLLRRMSRLLHRG